MFRIWKIKISNLSAPPAELSSGFHASDFRLCRGFGWQVGFRILLIGAMLLLATPVFAADLYFSINAKDVRVDDIFVVEARIASPNELINVADGSVLFDREKLEIKEISTGGSVFGLWAQNPSFSNSAGTISFVGGTADGFQGDGPALKAIVRAKEAGEARFSWTDDFSLFLADGKGTRVSPAFSPLAITIHGRSLEIQPKDEWKDFVEGDVISPEFVEAIISKDLRVFSGKYFVSFFAADKGSGVAYYEAKEGEFDWKRSVSPYVLEDQTLQSEVRIKAVDAAGNETVTTPEVSVAQEVPMVKYLFWILIGVMISAIIFIVIRRSRKV